MDKYNKQAYGREMWILSSAPGKSQAVGSCANGNESFCSIKGGVYNKLLKKFVN
jgi:hypothetical protein